MDEQESASSSAAAATAAAAMSEEEELKPYLKVLMELRDQPFNRSTTQKLLNHPYIAAARNGILTLAQRRAFCVEQLAIQRSDATSFARLAGHPSCWNTASSSSSSSSSSSASSSASSSLLGAIVPEPVKKRRDDLFQFLLGGEVYAAQLLVDHARSLQLNSEKDIEKCRPITAKGQAYPSYWARLSIDPATKRGAAAAAVAVNFPAWGQMCAELLDALETRPEYGYKDMKDDNVDDEHSKSLAFIQFFATPIPDLDIMAARILKEESITSVNEELLTTVRLLQEYEVMFWDACYEAK